MHLPAAVILALLGLGATARAADAPKPGPTSGAEPQVIEEGEASWYGPRHAGHRTSSGERFDPAAMTAAHPSLPLGTVIRVTVEDTGQSVVVRVNDRQPPHGIRVLDLSRAAASRLGIVARGAAMVQIAEAAPGDLPEEVAEAPDSAPVARHARRSGHGPHRAHARRRR